MSDENTDLATKYRPRTFKEVIGQDAAVASLKEVIKNGSKKAFIFTGNAGVGKTTISRIVAEKVGAKNNIIEVNGADKTGVDDMRDVMEGLRYKGFGSENRMCIIDECHRISQQSFDSMLKMVEEPPKGLYWALCTTDAGKIPKTIKTRCASYELQPVPTPKIFDLLKQVADYEGFTTSEDALYFIAEKCGGSPRQALTVLAQCSKLQDRKAVAEVMKVVTDDEDSGVGKLARMLSKGNLDWPQLMATCDSIKEMDGESVRMIIVQWFTKALMGTKDFQSAQPGLAVLDAFSRPYPQGSKIAPVILSLGELLAQR